MAPPYACVWLLECAILVRSPQFGMPWLPDKARELSRRVFYWVVGRCVPFVVGWPTLHMRAEVTAEISQPG